MSRRTQPLMLRLLLIAVYSAFFVVQIYLDASTIYSFPPQKSYQVSKPAASKEKYLQASTTPDVERINVLVNKRFHPENIPFLVYSFTVLQPVFISRTELNMLVTFPPVLPVQADSLRAPPAGPFTV